LTLIETLQTASQAEYWNVLYAFIQDGLLINFNVAHLRQGIKRVADRFLKVGGLRASRVSSALFA
jgi:hypothetical protein